MGLTLAAKVVNKVLNDAAAKEIIALKKYTPLERVKPETLTDEDKVRALYLYWACYRGHIPLIKFILETFKISPFMKIYEGKSPLMASLIGKHAPINVSVPQQSFSVPQSRRHSELIWSGLVRC